MTDDVAERSTHSAASRAPHRMTNDSWGCRSWSAVQRYASVALLCLAGCSDGGDTQEETGAAGSFGATEAQGGASDAGGATSAGSGTAASGGLPGVVGGDGGGTMTNCDCVTGPLVWGLNGGETPITETSSIDGCSQFVQERTIFGSEELPLTCSVGLDGCTDTLGVDDVNVALADSDVEMSVTVAPIVYGGDPRGVDGTVFRVIIGDSDPIDVGSPCADAVVACEPIPEGVQALVQVLQALTSQQLMLPQCGDFAAL